MKKIKKTTIETHQTKTPAATAEEFSRRTKKAALKNIAAPDFGRRERSALSINRVGKSSIKAD